MRFFGTTVRDTLAALSGPHLGSEGEKEKDTKSERPKALILLVITAVAILIGTFFIVLNEGNSQSVGSSIFGVVLGYWFK